VATVLGSSCARAVGVLVLVIGLVSGCTTLPPLPPAPETPGALAQALAEGYVAREDGKAGCSVAVATRAGSVYAQAGDGAGPHAVYRVASLSKIFLHLTLLRLETSGCVRQDGTVAACTHLRLPPEYAAVTLRDLAEHRSGLPREFLWAGDPGSGVTVLGGGCLGWDVYADFETRTDFVRHAWDANARAAVRHRESRYSNVGYGLLGMALADAAGKSLETLLREQCVGPLGLHETGYEIDPVWVARLTVPRAGDLPWLARRGQEIPGHALGEALCGAGGLYSSVDDCLRATQAYVRELEAQGMLKDLDTVEEGALRGTFHVSVRPDGRRVLFRTGMIYGGASFAGYDPQSETFLVILRNVTSWPDRVGLMALDRLATSTRHLPQVSTQHQAPSI